MLGKSLNFFPSDNDQYRKLTINNLNEVFTELIDASNAWLCLGLALGINYPTLVDISDKHPGDNKKCLLDMLACWLTSKSAPLTWGHLCECLVNTTVNRHDIAEKIEEKYKGSFLLWSCCKHSTCMFSYNYVTMIYNVSKQSW